MGGDGCSGQSSGGEEQEASRQHDVPGHVLPVLLPKRDLVNTGKFVDISTCTFHK